MIKFKLISVFAILISSVNCYFTLPGKCPENIELQSDFRLAAFFDKWYQTHFYSSDGQQTNNCATVELIDNSTGIFVNMSRVDMRYGRFYYSIGKLESVNATDDPANFNLTYYSHNAPRRLMKIKYPFRVLATNYEYYATLYTCNYSPLINKHFIYVWILSRYEILNDVSKELALKPLQQLGIDPSMIVKDDKSKCTPKYYEDRESPPSTFRYAVQI